MNQEPFDKTIKQALENIDIAFNADHWQQMEMLLHNLPIGDEGAIDAHFDTIIKDKINQPDVPLNHSAWAGIEAGLIKTEALDTTFDTAIADKISTPTSFAAPTNWESIANALDIAEAEDAAFDKEIYTSLQNLQASPPPNYWQRLVNKLNADFALREKLYRYKLIEATLMILLLLNFYQYLPSNYVFTSATILQQSPFEQSLQQVLPIDQKELDKKEHVPTKIVPKTNSINRTKATNKSKQPLIAKRATEKETPLVNQNLASTDIFRNYALTNPVSVLPIVMQQRSGLSISVSEMNQHLTLHTETGNSIIHTVPSLRPNFVESQYITPLGCKDCKYTKIPARLRLGLVANLASTNAYVSGGDILDISAFSEKGFGYGIGGSLGFKYGKWEIETGLMYAAKQYDPNIVDTPKPNAKRTHFQTVHLQTLHIPINVRYNYAVLGKGRWHLYVQTGAALNVMLRTEYDLAEVSSISRSKVNDITTSRINQIDFNNGLLGGGGLKNNRFLSINMGAGVERYISPRWSVFVQPDFHFHFSGNSIGPTEDRINTLSISFGARKSLY